MSELKSESVLPADVSTGGKLFHMKKLDYDLDLKAACRDEEIRDKDLAE